MPGGVPKLEGASYVEAPGTDGPPVAWWCYEDHRASVKRTIAAAGFPAEEVVLKGVTYDEMRPGCWQPKARLEDMSLNGVQAQLCFPNYPRFCGQQFLWGKDRTLALLCVEAYNDWMVEEWCGSSEGRLLPLCLIPLWDVDLAVAEVTRNAARGVRAVAFSELPTFLGLPSIYSGYWDPLFRVCQETGTVVCMHVGSGTKTPQTSPDAPDAVPATILFGNSIGGMSDFMFSGVLERFPQLKLLFAECQIGWIPYLLERADDVWLTHRGVEQLAAVLSRTTLHVLLPADLELLLQGSGWHGAPRPRRSPQCGLRDRLSPPRWHLAALGGGGSGAVRPSTHPRS